MQRFGLTLVQSGNMAVGMSLVSLFSPALFGRLDPGPLRRRAWVVNVSLLLAVLYLVVGLVQHAVLTVVLVLCIALLSGSSVLQYSDVRSSYPSDLTGRALSVFTMAMFLGVGVVQSLTGWVADWAEGQGMEPYRAVMACLAVLMAAGSSAFRWLPQSPLLHCPEPHAR